MRRWLALVAVVVAAFVAAGIPSHATAGPGLVACGAGYVSAALPWGHKCLRAGEFCKIGNVAYKRYGFICPSTGHLRRR